jgi:hypothetical protein
MDDVAENPSAAEPQEHASALTDERCSTTIEWMLLLAVVGLPSLLIFNTALNTLVEYYRMMTTINALPFP